MATYGIITYRPAPSNKPILTPDGAGGVFVELYTLTDTTAGNVTRKTFPNLLGMTLSAICVSGGYRDVTCGRGGDGVPYIDSTGYSIPSWTQSESPPWNPSVFNDVLAVFAR